MAFSHSRPPASRRPLWKSLPTVATIALVVLSGARRLPAAEALEVLVGADHPAVRYSGRAAGKGSGEVVLGHSGARVRLRFRGTAVAALLPTDTGDNHAVVFIDGEAQAKLRLQAEDGHYLLAENLPEGDHTVELVLATECNLGRLRFRGFEIAEGGEALPWQSAHDRKIEFIGDSVTCAYGVEADSEAEHFSPQTENFCLGYAGLTVRALDADYLVVARSGIGMIRNYDGPYEGAIDTMPQIYPYTFYGDTGHRWDPTLFVPHVVCFNIGPNDFSTSGLTELNIDRFVASFIEFADRIAAAYPEAKLVLIEGPMGGEDDPVTEPLRTALDRVLAHLEHSAPGRASFLWLSPEGTVGFGADFHPNRRQSEINAAELTAYLADLMGWH